MLTLQCNKTFQLTKRLEAISPRGALHAITSIVIVGGLLQRDQTIMGQKQTPLEDEHELSHNDYNRLAYFLTEMTRLGICLRNVEIKLNNDIYGDDFVKNPVNADFVLLSWVNQDPDWLEFGRSEMPESPALLDGKTWSDALSEINTQTSFIGIEGNPDARCVSQDDIPAQYYNKIAGDGRWVSLHAHRVLEM